MRDLPEHQITRYMAVRIGDRFEVIKVSLIAGVTIVMGQLAALTQKRNAELVLYTCRFDCFVAAECHGENRLTGTTGCSANQRYEPNKRLPSTSSTIPTMIRYTANGVNPCRRTQARNHSTTPRATRKETTNPIASTIHR